MNNSNNNSATLENEINPTLAWKPVEMELILGSGQPDIHRLEQGSHLFWWVVENVVVIVKIVS